MLPSLPRFRRHWWWVLFAVAVPLTACDLRPAPKPSLAPSPTSTGSAQVPQVPSDASTDAQTNAQNVSAECLKVATHVAQIMVDSAKDPSVRSTYEQAQPRMVRAMAEACNSQRWSAQVQTCYLGSKTEAEARACERTPAEPAAGSATPAKQQR